MLAVLYSVLHWQWYLAGVALFLIYEIYTFWKRARLDKIINPIKKEDSVKTLTVQSDFTVILQTKDANFKKVRDEVIKFAEIKQASDAICIFEITSLSIWNAIALGFSKDFIIKTLQNNSSGIPSKISNQISEWFERYGVVELRNNDEQTIILTAKKEEIKNEIKSISKLEKFIVRQSPEGFIFNNYHRGEIKSILVQHDLPVNDKIGYTKGETLTFKINPDVTIRDYQEDAAQSVYISGNGTAVGPCGCGKTIMGIRMMELCQTTTVIATNSQASVKQWKKSLLKFTNLTEDQISMYDKDNKVIKPVTITTYNMLAYKNKGEFIHFKNLSNHNWGLLVCDEVHLLPADMFRIVSSLQSLKRMALTASFIREDDREKEILSLIGPKRFDKPWKDLEAKGHIAKMNLREVRVPMNEVDRKRYVEATNVQDKFLIASTASTKLSVIKQLLEKHKNDKVLIIGNFTEHLLELSKELNIPCVYGESNNKEREKYYDQMRNDEINQLIASKIATTALDIPKINVVIQVSIQYGSRSAEAQVAGRASRPKEVDSFLYTIVSKDTKEEDYNHNRQQFLTDEGYRYEITEMAA